MFMTQKLKDIIVNNARRLITNYFIEGDKMPSQAEIGKKIGISQRSVSYLFDNNNTIGSLRTDTIHLLIPNLPIEELTSKRLEKMIENYVQSPTDGRENIARIAENEVRYSYQQRPQTINGD